MAAHAYHDRNGVLFVPFHQLPGSSPSVDRNLMLVPQAFVPLNPSVPHVLVPYYPPVLPLDGMDEERSISLLQFMVNEGLLLSPEEDEKRRNVILKLKQIVLAWIKRIARQRGLSREHVAVTCATIVSYGSYGLGVHGLESDIDALCVGPCFATTAEDFFVVLYNMLKSIPEVLDIHCVKDAKVPLMRFKFNEISIDLPYAKLPILSVPENVDVLSPFSLMDIDETSWRSLSGVRANKRILQLIPNLENFQSMLRCVKLWAKRRGVYGNLLGFLGGIHLAILAAFVCQRHPNASLNGLIMNFFETFAFWSWPTPVILQDGSVPTTGDANEARSLMPIRLPCSPYEYCHSNITRSTFYRIRVEFLRGHNMTRDLLKPDFDWVSIFEPFRHSMKYSRFAKIYLSALEKDDLGDWVGWVKSRFRCLLAKLEEMQDFCDPNPTEYEDMDVTEPNVVFYWGLNPRKSNFMDIDLVQEDFMKNVNNCYHRSPGRMKLSIIQASQLPNNFLRDTGSGKGRKAGWKILDNDGQRKPDSQHLPHNGEPHYPSDGG